MSVTVNLRVAPRISEDKLPSGKVGQQYSASVSATGSDPINISVSGLPEGLVESVVRYSYKGVSQGSYFG